MRRFGALSAIVVAVAALGSGLVGCSSRGLGPGEARLSVVSGRAQVAATGENWHSAHNDQRLHRNDRVRVLSGLSDVHFSSDRAVELRPGGELQVLPEPALLKGDVLATAKSTTLTVAAGTANARVRDGAAHVTRGLGVTAASYEGDLSVTSAGRDLTVPALRQAGVPGPGLIFAPSPLDYRADNPWDRRYLGDAIDLGDELQARSNGFTAQLAPGEGQTVGFYRQLMPALENQPAFTQALLQPDISPGETLVGAAIAVQGHSGSFLDRWRAVFAFRDQGARWGLVALDQHVTRGPLLSEVDDALGRRSVGTSVAAPQPGGPAPSPLATTPPAATPADNSGGTGNGASSGGGSGGGGGRSTPPTTAPTAPQQLLPPILNPPSPSPTTTVPPANPVGGLIQGVGNVVGGLLGGLLGGGR